MAMFPIRCVVETVGDGQCTKCSVSGAVLVDSYAIVSGFTQLSQLVDTVLMALGLQHLSYGAQGTIQVKNWKPLTFEEVTDDPDIEVENLLKDISNHLTLRIVTKQSDSAVSDCVRDMKDRLLQTVWHKLPHLLNDIHQPQLKELVTNLVQGEGPQAIDAQLMYMFNVWLEQMNKSKGSSSVSLNIASNGRVGGLVSPGVHPTNRFSPTLEIPKLERWFRENQNPTRQKLLQYMTLLNGSNFRKHNTKISYQQMCNWFINARATLRKRMLQQRRSDQGVLGVSAPSSATPPNSGGEMVVTESSEPMQTENSDGSSPWPGRSILTTAAAAAAGRSSSLSFNNLMSSKLSTTGGGDSTAVAAPQADNVTANDESTSPANAKVDSNGQRSPSASSRTSGDASVTVKDEMSFGADESVSGVDQDHSLYYGSISMSRTDTCDNQELSVSPLMENGGSSGAAASNLYNVNANRTRLMFDPLTELPMLERWFEENPHPSWVQVDQFTEMLNVMPYRQTYPPVSSHNVKIWFKNRRAKFKRNLVGAVKNDSASSTAAAAVN
ncbi:Homeobox domain containing protein [Trichuris trichiura]|uniref:Homeobox domain containing protein n=1 Tax=Trichuris trichiura TaxID=36087 RepID=A0A077YYT7_TRITR|nr:Homeobox domain containing protein [Trichuris trichiura]